MMQGQAEIWEEQWKGNNWIQINFGKLGKKSKEIKKKKETVKA